MDLFLIQWIYFRLFIVVNQFLRKWTIRPSLPEIPVTMEIPPPTHRSRPAILCINCRAAKEGYVTASLRSL